MNHILSYAASAPQYFSTAFKEIVLPQLTEQQKKILVISSIALSIFTAMFIVSRCCLTRNTPSSPIIPPYVPPTKGGFQKPPYIPDSPSPSPKLPFKKTPLQTDPFFTKPFQTDPFFTKPFQTDPTIDPFVVKPSQTTSQSDPFFTKPFQTDPTFDPFVVKPSQTTSHTDPFSFKPFQPTPQPDPFVTKPFQPYVTEPKKPVVDPAKKTTPRVPREGLDGTEDAIKFLQEDIYLQQQIVQLANSTPPTKVKQDDMDEEEYNLMLLQRQLNMEEAEARMQELEDNLDDLLASYPDMVRKYLEDKFSTYSYKDTHEIYDHLVMLSGFMETNAQNKDFIHNCFKQIDAFLSKSLFTSATEVCLQEQQKTNFIVFHEFVAIADKHINMIAKTDPQLARRLKIKLANMPLTDHIDPKTNAPKDRRELFPNAHLSEQEQVAILTDHFQTEEDNYVASILLKIPAKKFSEKDLKKLAKMVSNDKSNLSSGNKHKLRDEIAKAIGTSAPTGSADSILPTLKSKLTYNPYGTSYSYGYTYNSDTAEILNLHRASKAKKFFERQIGLPEDQTQIPRWYHATPYKNLVPIMNSQINVEHKQAFKGAWVSNRPEWDFGGYGGEASVFCLSHRISKLDPNVFIGYEKGGEGNVKGLRWRGLQCPIPMLDKRGNSHVSIIGIYKSATKTLKQSLTEDLKKKKMNAVVVSVDQVKYLQTEILKTIGSPNLTAKWWGKADESQLDKQLPQKKSY